MKFVDLFAGLGGFHAALAELGHECVFASELDPELRELYRQNWPSTDGLIHGDIRLAKNDVPRHDILCAGFPCQPFSKSGYQHGVHDRTRGTLFAEVLDVLERRRPLHVILENVGNFERHDSGRTWQIVHQELAALGYTVRGTEHKASGGHGLISPDHLGYPHRRERFFAIASRRPLAADPFPRPALRQPTSLTDIVQLSAELTPEDRRETRLTELQTACIEHWNEFLERIPPTVQLPSFPIWGDELWHSYPFAGPSPTFLSARQLEAFVSNSDNDEGSEGPSRAALLERLPAYAKRDEAEFPRWKSEFIRQNRDFFAQVRRYLGKRWVHELQKFPPSLRKLEWNCKGEKRNLWAHVLQFRPSGLRAKRYSASPALVSMTTTQIPILGPKKRFISRVEGLRLQGFPDDLLLPKSRQRAFAALGNAVHVGVVKAIAGRVLSR